MSKQIWKPGNMLYPLPVVMVSCGDKRGNTNILTVAWTGTICTAPAMVYISVRPERYSYQMIRETGEFVINLTNKSLAKATDYCGVRSGRDVDKFSDAKLTRGKAENLEYAPIIEESPVSIECRVVEVKELGSHHMFIAEVLSVDVDEQYMDNKGKFRLNSSDLMVYSHGEYYNLKEQLGTFGYSVKRKSSNKMSLKKKLTDKNSKKSSDKYTGNTGITIKDADFKVTSIVDAGYKDVSKESGFKESRNKDSSYKGSSSRDSSYKGSGGKDSGYKGSSGRDSSYKGSGGKDSSYKGSGGKDSSYKGYGGKDSSYKGSSSKDSSYKGSSSKDSSYRGSSSISDRSFKWVGSSDKNSSERNVSDRSSSDKNSSNINSSNKKYPSKRK